MSQPDTLPRHALYPWFKERDEGFVHPDDFQRFVQFDPYGHMFAVKPGDQGYIELWYGKQVFRVKPGLLRPVPDPAFNIGQQVSAFAKMWKQRWRFWAGTTKNSVTFTRYASLESCIADGFGTLICRLFPLMTDLLHEPRHLLVFAFIASTSTNENHPLLRLEGKYCSRSAAGRWHGAGH
jgi:hypothetical protein